MTSRAHAAIALLAIACSALLWSCDSAGNPSPGQAQVESPPQSSAALRGDELVLIDRVTALETLVPDASQRDLYEVKEAVTENAQRSYTFALKSQPTMDPSRHFQIITVTWGRPGTSPDAGAIGSGVSGTGGPGGGFVEKTVRTSDGTYEVRVALGELLPKTAKTAAVDLDTLAQRLLNEYNDAKTRQP
jgi:hypothetical protein